MSLRSVVLNENAFGDRHVVLWGRGRRHYVAHFCAPVSVKSVVSGRAVWRTDEGVHPLEPGRLLLLNAEHPYTVEIDAGEPVETFCVFFRSGFVEDIARATTTSADSQLDNDRPGEYRFLEATHHDESIATRLSRVHHHVKAGSDPIRLDLVVIELAEQVVRVDAGLQRLAGRIPAARPATRREVLRRVLHARDFIESSLASSLTLDEVARQAALSPYHLHRMFRRTFGQPIHEFITRRRLDRAAELLSRTSLSITEICTAVGFESPTSFATLFRRHYSLSPREFRKNREDPAQAAH